MKALLCPGNVSRCLTLNELIVSAPEGQCAFQSQEEVIFLSGVHVVNGTNKPNLIVSCISDLTMRGGSNHVTITCLENFYFEFEQVANV